MSTTSPINILLADHSATIRKVVEIIFSGNEYSLSLAKNGAEALQAAAENRPDVMLIDVMMTDMDGYQFCQEVRNKPELAAVPVLLMTGSFEPFDEERARSCGATDHITKPFESQQLINKVQELYLQAEEQKNNLAETDPATFSEDEQSTAAEADFASSLETDFTFGQDADDPWGAFASQDADDENDGTETADVAEAAAELSITENGFDIELPDVLEMLQDDEAATAPEIAATAATAVDEWTPSEDHTYIFETETETEPQVIVQPVQETIAELPSEAIAIAPAVTQEQLQEALSAISTEIIEKLVREIVPTLAEKLIREEIAKITGKTDVGEGRA
ncbi:MAG: response regulator [Trichlorobacter sp.]|nr:response regulator [Trichlorobacter sp.]